MHFDIDIDIIKPKYLLISKFKIVAATAPCPFAVQLTWSRTTRATTCRELTITASTCYETCSCSRGHSMHKCHFGWAYNQMKQRKKIESIKKNCSIFCISNEWVTQIGSLNWTVRKLMLVKRVKYWLNRPHPVPVCILLCIIDILYGIELVQHFEVRCVSINVNTEIVYASFVQKPKKSTEQTIHCMWQIAWKKCCVWCDYSRSSTLESV